MSEYTVLMSIRDDFEASILNSSIYQRNPESEL